jgi:predicted metal-dependent hydrolase
VREQAEPAAINGNLRFGSRNLAYTVERTQRRKSIAISVDLTGVRVLAPADATSDEIEATLQRKAPWVLSKLSLVEEMGPGAAPREFVSGETFHYLGRAYRLRVLPDASAVTTRVRLSGRHLLAPLSIGLDQRLAEIAVRRGLIVWYERRARERLPERIAFFAERVGVRPPHLLVRDQEKRWGSCDGRGRIRANWRLMTLPLPLIDYVLAHEVCHVVEPNHRPPFWRLLGVVMPDWEVRRAALRSAGPRFAW